MAYRITKNMPKCCRVYFLLFPELPLKQEKNDSNPFCCPV
ncbi:MAG: hypothetical protein AVDCRST_MAG95-1199 [uncultured Adhaeribacter sp.]|uniref:Uncharacterized protein n=1 Tax=uncultured Adhaeribacter sp. TaxID=448109 RepID=A0A6J4HXA9_9BACT|nr:MAG: hypothetical protein AVDCRST_MAG95-1199 [uncultured Adhaeribacter sp.]